MIAPIEQIAGNQVTLAQIDTACELFEKASSELDTSITELKKDLEVVKQKHLRAIKKQAGVVATRQAGLESLIERGDHLFVKPRTITLHGVKVGLTSAAGTLKFDDEETVIKLIKKFHDKDADTYIQTDESVKKNALKQLTAQELGRLGCRIEGAGDAVVLNRVAGDVEKLLSKMIAELVEAISDSGD